MHNRDEANTLIEKSRFITTDETETEEIGEQIGRRLLPGAVIALVGDLGTGKTVMTRGIVRGIDPESDCLVSSPSFTIVIQYPTRIPVHHIDLFRLTADDDFIHELEEYCNEVSICIIEWADRLTILPLGTIVIELKWLNESERSISISSQASGMS